MSPNRPARTTRCKSSLSKSRIASFGSKTPTATASSISRIVFADQMMFPEGAMFFDGSLYVSAPPSIWKLTDNDGDGVADERVEWFQGKTLTGCANDLHGPYAGPDGWIYWCKGAFAEQTHIVNGREWKTKAAHIFRCRPDGTGFEPVMTGGMDNPVDVAFMPDGERILSGTFFHVNPRHDGLIHADLRRRVRQGSRRARRPSAHRRADAGARRR